MKDPKKVALIVGLVLLGLLPVVALSTGKTIPGLNAGAIAGLNLLAWSIVLTLLLTRDDLHRGLKRVASEFGISPRHHSFERLLQKMLTELSRRQKAISVNLIEQRIDTNEELSETLERIVTMAYKLLGAESAELALFDVDSGMYHSSFVLGKPFRSSAQAMLAGAVEGDSVEVYPDVMIQPIAFSGSVLGSLRVALKKDTVPSVGDREIMQLLAVQSGLAIINAEYTGELMRMKRTADESVKAKTGFLANLSHELRGPLGIMLNAVELVLDGLCGPVSEDQLDTLRMVKGNGDHLLELINDVLDYAKVESGKVTPHPVEIQVDDLLQDLVGVVRKQAESKSHRLSFKPFNEVLAIACDRRHLRQMLINLLTNAVKYTPDGGVIELWAEAAPGNKVKICVRDNGVGIEENDRHKVFSAFERIEHSYSINQMGTGLGMPLTKKLAEVNGGIIDFDSSPGDGSTFWISFPRVQYDPARIDTSDEEEIVVYGEGETVLLVEGSEGERKMMSRYLSHINFNVIAVTNRSEAVAVLNTQDVMLVVLDSNVLESLDAGIVRELRKQSKNSSVPLLLVSSRAFVFDVEKFLREGADRCLAKPFELRELGATCRELIDSYLGRPTRKERTQKNLPQKPSAEKEAGPKKKSKFDDIVH